MDVTSLGTPCVFPFSFNGVSPDPHRLVPPRASTAAPSCCGRESRLITAAELEGFSLKQQQQQNHYIYGEIWMRLNPCARARFGDELKTNSTGAACW